MFFLTDIFNGQNIVLLSRKLLLYMCQIGMLENLVCVMLTLRVETVLPLNALRRQMPLTTILTYPIDAGSGLMRLAGICYFYCAIHKLS
jgi:hypothetical protein